jgi:hypothetical protein
MEWRDVTADMVVGAMWHVFIAQMQRGDPPPCWEDARQWQEMIDRLRWAEWQEGRW